MGIGSESSSESSISSTLAYEGVGLGGDVEVMELVLGLFEWVDIVVVVSFDGTSD